MHKFVMIPTLLAASVWALHCSANDLPQDKPQRDAANETTDQGKGRPRGKKPNLAGRLGGGDQAKVVSRLIEQFDKDGDEKLDASELTALLSSMRERAGNSPVMEKLRPGARTDRPSAEAGGDLPKRPASE